MGRRLHSALAALALCGCGAKDAFPNGFLWGTAIAGFQVDMGCPTLGASDCDDPSSDWYQWVTRPEVVQDPAVYVSGEPLSHGPGHWELFDEDARLAKDELHNNALRLSVEWSRIFPVSTVGIDGYDALKQVASAKALEHYHQELKALRRRGLTPLVTLEHNTLPSWIHDAVGCHQDFPSCTRRGWVDRESTVREIAKYAGFCAKEFGGEVDLWATVNEPIGIVVPGYLYPSQDRSNPPGLLLHTAEAREVVLALIEAHARMYDAIHQADTEPADGHGPAAKVGLVLNVAEIVPRDPANDLDQAAARNVDYLYNAVFLEATVKGELDATLDRHPVHRDDLAGRMDWLGVNYYTRLSLQGTEQSVLPALSPLLNFNILDVRQSESPSGLYAVLSNLRRYGLPMYLTENGTAKPDTGTDREAFLVQHLGWLRKAIADGADVRGYFYWSLVDNYEWNQGTNLRFGLYAVDPNDPTKRRTRRAFADSYGRIAKDNRIPDDLTKAHPL